MPLIPVGGKIWPRHGGRRQVCGGEQVAAQHFLLVLTVQPKNPRQQILDVSEQQSGLPAARTCFRRCLLPNLAATAMLD
jgi:hypothetical protein